MILIIIGIMTFSIQIGMYEEIRKRGYPQPTGIPTGDCDQAYYILLVVKQVCVWYG